MTDRLTGFFNQYALNARMFFSGSLCDNIVFDEHMGGGFLHLVRKGRLKVYAAAHAEMHIEEPSLIFYPGSSRHQFVFDGEVDLTCAIVDLGGSQSLLVRALPEILCMTLKQVPTLAATLHLLFDEAAQSYCGRQAAIDRLFQYLVIQLLRHILDHGQGQSGLIAGLNDKRLAAALRVMHDTPGQPWTLDRLAQQAGMSRARFAAHFKATLGMTPVDYLTQVRIHLAQNLLLKGQAVGIVANAVGYSNASVFSRVFKAQTSMSPSDWKRSDSLL